MQWVICADQLHVQADPWIMPGGDLQLQQLSSNNGTVPSEGQAGQVKILRATESWHLSAQMCLYDLS